MATRVIYAVTNNIIFDQRVQKMAAIAESLGASVTITGRKFAGDVNFTLGSCRIVRFRLPVNSGFLFYAFYNLRLLFYLVFNRFDVIVSNDLDTLIPCRIIARLRRNSRLIFDSHEYFTGVPELKDRDFVRGVWKRIERKLLPGLENVITVSEAIAERYREEYEIEAKVVRNLSLSSEHVLSLDRKNLFAAPEDLICIIQGTGLNTDSGLEELVKAVETTESVHLVIIGSGLSLPIVRDHISRSTTTGKFTVLPAMEWDKMMSYTRAADIGFFLHKPDAPNPAMSMPNKLFEYISAGICVVTSPVEGVRKVVEEYETGVVLERVTVEDISETITNLNCSRKELERYKENSRKASLVLNWDTEKRKMEDLYKSLFVL